MTRAQISKDSNSRYKLDPLDRRIVGWLASMDLWSKTAIAEAFGISRKAVLGHELRYGGEVWSGEPFARREEVARALGPRLGRVQAVAGRRGQGALSEDELPFG